MTLSMFDTVRRLHVNGEDEGAYHSLPALEAAGLGKISRLPVSIRVMLESVLRNCDGERVS